MIIAAALTKCADGLGIELADNRCVMISKDLVDVFRYDSVEDILMALKRGRQGVYGFDYHNRNKLSMPLIHYWISLLMEEKAEAREKEAAKHKSKSTLEIDGVDYEAYKAKIAKQQESTSKSKRDKLGWNKFISTGFKQKVIDCEKCKGKKCPKCKGYGKIKVSA